MKNLDERLQNAAALPGRELSSNFTARVVAEIKAQPNQLREEFNPMKRHLAPLAAALAIIATVLIGGVTYAATDGFTKPFNLSNIFGYKVIEETDNKRVIAIQTANCTVGAVEAPHSDSDQTLYFRPKDTPVSEGDVIKWLQGYCESLNSYELYRQSELQDMLEAQDRHLTGGIVESIDGEILKTSWTIGKDSDRHTFTETFRISSDTVVVHSKSAPSTISKGDYVTVLTRYDESNPDTPQPAYYIIHQSRNVHYYEEQFDKYHAALERVKPCDMAFCAYDSASGNASTQEDEDEALTFVKNAYESYKTDIEDASIGWDMRFKAAKQSFAQYTTPQLAIALEKWSDLGDPILCTQQALIPHQMAYAKPVVHGSTVTVPILRPTQVGEMKEDGTSNMQPKAFVDVSYSTILKKIISIDCTHSLPS